MFKVKGILWKETSAGTAHQQLIRGNLRDKGRQVVPHLVP